MTTEEENKILESLYPNYKIPVPPVCTAYWDLESWKTWIETHGTWDNHNKPNKLFIGV